MKGDVMREGKIRVKTLQKFLMLCDIAEERNRMLYVDEVIQEIHCCRSHAYNYLKALKILFPPEAFNQTLPIGDIQLCLRE